MDNLIVDEKLAQYQSNLDSLLGQLEDFATNISNQQLQVTIRNLRTNINEPFLFVIVGEVKAGKSSFVNALLQADICKTAADPCTDIIQQIVYSEKKEEQPVSQYLRKIGLPKDILKNLSVVDTPGTNTIVENHQEITKEFIPNSDLIFFVFFAKNPYTRSAWDLLDYVNSEWRKKVVFILQQADLTKPEELAKNKEKLTELALQKGIESPIVFATSVEYEVNGEPERSGFNDVRNYIQQTLKDGGTKKLKLQGVANTSEQIIDLLNKDLFSIQQQLVTDQLVVNKIKNKLQQNKRQSGFELESLINRLLAKYDNITTRVKLDFREKLSLLTLVRGSFAVLFRTNKSAPTWMDELKQSCENELKSSLGEISQDGIKHFVGGIRELLQSLVDDLHDIKVNQINTNAITVNTIESRQEIVEDVQQKVSTLLDDKTFLNSIESVNASVAPRLVGGGAATVAGTAIAALTEIVLLDIIGTAFAGVGILFAGGTLVLKKRKIIKQFEEKLDREKARFESEISDKLNSKLDIIYEEIERNFVNIYDYVEAEEQKVMPLLEQFKAIEQISKELIINNK
ncbi:dynamin family protein [Waterburya agarophytonicola K14]|uniref:Dynamin family protein n=1 Tax=Waterburya agarophytonicola KI4 TaxID=2874699 RepID=A0A964BSK3_9CYAN|nr:dynamin family protein [Waterburya agarophytonicola]MCC0178983.1 dynamin family protein [Waterburya agarophytonicola KI4]